LSAYFTGDEERVTHEINEELKHATAAQKRTFEHLLFKRNRTMAQRIINKIKAHPNTGYVFAFGTAHFVGQKRIQIDLEKAGFTVRRLHSPVR
jgi:uncharacterized protein YbaP (TraB family)